jgi:GNAT superfamily N-acetyltransferase
LSSDVAQDFQVRQVSAKDLLELRRRVLRADNPESSVEDPRDDEVVSRHFGGFLGPRVVASASWFSSAAPVRPELRSYQLRYMAIDFDVQGRGYGGLVVDAALKELRALGVEQVWANARDSALGFYQATGWSVVAGSEHFSHETQLPHTVIFRHLLDATPSGALGG